MTAVSHTISSLLNGVSQQPAIARLPSQLEEQVDCWSNLEKGLMRRPPWRHRAKLAGTNAGNVAGYANAIVHSVNRDNTERYTVVIRNGAIEVFDTATGAAKTVTTPNGTSYLNCSNPQEDLRVLTVEDYTFVVNRSTAVAMTAEAATSYTYGGTVAALSELAAHDGGNLNKYWKVQTNSNNVYGTFYTVYLSDGGSSGYWTEIPKPGVLVAFDPATMPHALISNADGTFTFKRLTWAKRQCGDEEAVPVPSWVGKPINDIFFTRRRLGWIAGTSIAMSRGRGDYFNFWQEKASQVLSTDPIDINEEHPLAANGFHAASSYKQDAVLFSEKGQFRLSTLDVSLSPNTIDIRCVSSYNSSVSKCRPVELGDACYFPLTIDNWSKFFEFSYAPNQTVASAPGINDHIPEYVPKYVLRLNGSTEARTLFALSQTDRTRLYAWTHYEQDQQRQHSSWSKWGVSKGGSIIDFSVDRWEVIAGIQHTDGVYLEVVNMAPQPTDSGCFYTVHLDRRVDQSQVTKTFDGTYTTFALPYEPESGAAPYLVPNEPDAANGIVDPTALIETVSATQWKIAGNWTAREFFIGCMYNSWGELSEQFAPRASNAASNDKTFVDEGRLTLQRIMWLLYNTSALAASVWEKSDIMDFGAGGAVPIAGVGAPAALDSPSVPSVAAFKTDGKYPPTRRRTSKYKQPINKRSTRAIVRFGSVDHRPFYITSAMWHGNYTYTRQQV